MAGGGKKRYFSKKSKGGNSSYSSLFVVGGVLSDWSPSTARNSSNGKGNSSKSVTRSGNSGDGKKGASSSKSEPQKKLRGGSAFGYVYPAMDSQEHSVIDGGNNMDESHPMVLVDSKNTQIIAYVDQTPFMEPQSVKYNYEYSAGLGLDDTSHRGLGFSDEVEEMPNVINLYSNMDVKEGICLDSPSSEEKYEEEMETNITYVNEVSVGDDMLAETPSLEQNSGYLSIGGMKLYTQDISDGESDQDHEEEFSDGESLESSGSEESSGSTDSNDSSDSDSSIDEEVAEDYFEGIGGSERVVNADRLVGKLRHVVDDDDISGGSFNETLQKLGGIDLQDASREYGMKTPQSRRRYSTNSSRSATSKYAWSSALDDLMFVKDYRTVSGKKKHGSRFPESWPSEAQKSKHFRKFPGEKKKHRKETIALKRRERMIRRGVDLGQINAKLQQMVLDGVDILSFWPMHSRDCSQVRRLAAIYRLQSGCQNSGKKRFITVMRTEHTCMPSSSDKVRLEKLIGAGGDDTDFTVNDIKLAKGDRKTTKKASKVSGSGSALKKSLTNSADHRGTKERKGKKKNEEKGSYAAQPLSFVSSGIMHSETEIKTLNTIETDSNDKKVVASSSSYGAFELHTTGFGSKMMAKMGYVEGGGLGKDGQGRADVIEVIQRPKSLGLGANLPETSIADPIKVTQRPKKSLSQCSKGSETSNKSSKMESQQFAAFEKHTKGFGSKMMAKMGFVEGTGLGRDSQGIVNPLVASRLPKSRGLGAKG